VLSRLCVRVLGELRLDVREVGMAYVPNELLSRLVGRTLYAVVFLKWYCQPGFDGALMNCDVWPQVDVSVRARSGTGPWGIETRCAPSSRRPSLPRRKRQGSAWSSSLPLGSCDFTRPGKSSK